MSSPKRHRYELKPLPRFKGSETKFTATVETIQREKRQQVECLRKMGVKSENPTVRMMVLHPDTIPSTLVDSLRETKITLRPNKVTHSFNTDKNYPSFLDDQGGKLQLSQV